MKSISKENTKNRPIQLHTEDISMDRDYLVIIILCLILNLNVDTDKDHTLQATRVSPFLYKCNCNGKSTWMQLWRMCRVSKYLFLHFVILIHTIQSEIRTQNLSQPRCNALNPLAVALLVRYFGH